MAIEKDELDFELKKYKLDSLLLLIAKKTQDMGTCGIIL